MKIIIETIPFEKQRYPTCGDYYLNGDGSWHVFISEMRDERSEWLVLLHELAELALVLQRQIPVEAIDRFDIDFEAARKPGDESEPGDAGNCPYREEHTIATSVERLLCESLGLKWSEHEKIVSESNA